MSDLIYDIEVYPNVFLITILHSEINLQWTYEINQFKNDSLDIINFMRDLRNAKHRLVGFNNIGFDYPILHTLIRMCYSDSLTLYEKASAIIKGDERSRWSHLIKPSECVIEQVDLFKIHHFDNKAKSTSLKLLEFNMRSNSIQELPFAPGSILSHDETEKLKMYNIHDVEQTKEFYLKSLDMIRFRKELTEKYNHDFTNSNNTKIGKDYFIMELEKSGIQCYEYGQYGRKPKQTVRDIICLNDCIFNWIKFDTFEFNLILDWLKCQKITETKNVFTKLIATVNGFDFVFGLGGIHGSVESSIIETDDEFDIIDIDVKSYYPNLAIVNKLYPKHLTSEFCDIYCKLYSQREKYPKEHILNGTLKLALNGVYGDSNNPFSVFYDPVFTMSITLNGQLLLCMLAEKLLNICNLQIIQVNTDGVTVKCPKVRLSVFNKICLDWQELTKLKLEQSFYTKMFIRDVNNYIAVYNNEEIKRIGAYEYELEWHQNHSCLVVPKVAEQVLIYNKPIAETIINWPDKMDFMLRTKVPRTGKLVMKNGDDIRRLQNITRYFVSKTGGYIYKVLPPLKGKINEREIAIESGWRVCECNDLTNVDYSLIDYKYYINEVEKLCLGLK